VTDENEAGIIWQTSVFADVKSFAQERQHHKEQDDACIVTSRGQYNER